MAPRQPHREIVENADLGTGGRPTNLVHRLKVGGHDIEPPWFTSRPDTNFRDWIPQWTERPPKGLGGQRLRRRRLTVDPHAGAMTLECTG